MEDLTLAGRRTQRKSSKSLKVFVYLANMAAGGTGFAETDQVTDQLLSHVSGHVISETRKKFATGPLGLSLTQYGHIEEDERYAASRNIEVSLTQCGHIEDKRYAANIEVSLIQFGHIKD